MGLESRIDHFLGFETFIEAGRYSSILHNSVDKQARAIDWSWNGASIPVISGSSGPAVADR